MANARRGEIEVEIGGRRHGLCLTLGALAELEARLGAGDLEALGRRLGEGRLSAEDLMAILAAGLRGGGDPSAAAEVEAWPASELAAAMEAAVRLLVATFGGAGEAPPAGPFREPPPPGMASVGPFPGTP